MAAVDANKILAEVDRRAAVFDDQQYSASMTIFKGGQLKKTLEFNMVMKGLDKQFITFTAPGDVAGMKVLLQDAETLYVYTPEFKKVRRVAAHMQNQGFMGSTFTYEDMVQVQLVPFYDAALGGKEGSETTLTLTPKQGKTTTYSRVDVVIDGTKGGVTKLRYYDGAGNHVRTQLREGWTKIDGELMPTKISMTDLKAGDTTVIELSSVQVNQGVDDDIFSRRMLLRG
jgi:outer membrane lipoprotein-sorting protein